MSTKVAIIGLDCAAPELVFDRFADDLPVLTGLRERGVSARLRSIIPPITVPAWSCMMSGADPGQLGIYGFRNRTGHTYDDLSVATSRAVTRARLWQILSRAGRRVGVLGVPQTYPPAPVNGHLVSSFLTPSTDVTFTHPPELAGEIMAAAGQGGYEFDVKGFRTDDKDRLARDIRRVTRKGFDVAEHLLRGNEYDFFMTVVMGTDRIHHGFWAAMDAGHRKHVPGNPHADTIREYYRFVDARLGRLLDLLDERWHVLVVSDHGCRALVGGVRINEWLIQEGLLKLKAEPGEPCRLVGSMIDWSGTKAWGEGGYYARVFLNVAGREPEGQVPAGDYESFRTDLIGRLTGMSGPDGKRLGTVCHRAEEIYEEVNGFPPDILCFFGDLDWRSVGQVGTGEVFTYENDTGPDDANHDWEGIFIAAGPEIRRGVRFDSALDILSVAPTVLEAYGLPPEPWMKRPSFWGKLSVAGSR